MANNRFDIGVSHHPETHINADMFIVLCREDRQADGTPGRYVLATQRLWFDKDAATHYAEGISSSRKPMVAALLAWRTNPNQETT